MSTPNHKPFFSIVIPTFNTEKYIERCILSCLEQTEINFELIFVDDCGSDNSINIVRNYSIKDERVRIIHNPFNLGTFHSRRIGTFCAKGKYIIFLDPDDALDINSLKFIYKSIKNNFADIIYYSIELNELHRNPKIPKNNFTKIKNNDTNSIIFKRSIYSFGTPGKAYAKETLINAFIGLNIPEKERLVYAEDALIYYAALGHSKKSLSLEKPIYKYYVSHDSITLPSSLTKLRYNQDQILKVIEYINKNFESNPTIPIKLKNHIVKKLNYDYYMIARNHKDENGKSLYLTSTLKAFKYRPSIKELARIIISITSFGKIKI